MVRARQEREDDGQIRAQTPGVGEVVKLEIQKRKMLSKGSTAAHQIHSKVCGFPSM